jgi:Lantibiotic dehydratase, N terminus
VVVRSAGFPAAEVLALSDPDLARAADAGADDFDLVYERATVRLSEAIRRFASEPRFREAVTWQNRRMLDDCLDKAAAGEPRNVRGRNHELAIASYAQRYCVKNDTIGFFGPVGWAAWAPTERAVTAQPGPDLLTRRTVYFEVWAIDAVVHALGEDPALLPWLPARPVASNALIGRTVHLVSKPPVTLSDADAALLARCDGVRSATELAAELEAPVDEVVAALVRMRDQELLDLDFEGPLEARPEASLRERLGRVGDPDVRARALALLDEVVAARDALAGAAGDARRVATAMDRLNQTFERITGDAATRRHGRTYAGRTLVYEDTVRGLQVTLGRPLLDALAPPLAILLDAARWLTAAAAREYLAVFQQIHWRLRDRTGEEAVPLAALMRMATPHLMYSPRRLPRPVHTVIADFQGRWARVLEVPEGVRRHTVSSADIAERAREAFPAGPPAWAAAVHHAPDVMIAAGSLAAIERGDFLFVLGEMHVAENTIESRLFVEQHEEPARLFAADEADHGDRRVYPTPTKEWGMVTSRLFPPTAMLSPRFTYWAYRESTGGIPGPVLPAADMRVHAEGDRLVVRSRTHDLELDLLEVLGEYLSGAVVNGFHPLPAADHRPRLTIDRFVVARESWTLPANAAEWAFVRDEAARYRACRAWRAAHELPERAFYKVPAEDKPRYVDLSSIVLVNTLAKAVRQTAEDRAGTFTMTEMLPDLDQVWLPDAAGARYTTELRLVAVDPRYAQRSG